MPTPKKETSESAHAAEIPGFMALPDPEPMAMEAEVTARTEGPSPTIPAEQKASPLQSQKTTNPNQGTRTKEKTPGSSTQGSTKGAPDKPEPDKPRKKADPEQVEFVGGMIGGGLATVGLFAGYLQKKKTGKLTRDFLPTQAEAEAIAIPLGRIASRRMPEGMEGINESDLADGISAGLATLDYGARALMGGPGGAVEAQEQMQRTQQVLNQQEESHAQPRPS